MANGRRLTALACLVAAAAASTEPGTCVQDAVSAVQARRAVPEVHAEPAEQEVDEGVDQTYEENPGLFIHKELHLELPAGFENSRLGLLAMVQRGRVSMHQPFDCAALPYMCEAPFNCQNWTLKDTLGIMLNGFATKDGKANPRSWCMPGAQAYADTMLKECVARGNPHGSAQLLRERSLDLGHQEMDASYCFAEGHCRDFGAGEGSAAADSEQICDSKFGRDGWTTDLLKSLTKSFSGKSAQPNLMNLKHGFNNRAVTEALTKMSCAMGVYHCDVQYCKHTYCKDEHYRSKYSFMEPPSPQHVLEA